MMRLTKLSAASIIVTAIWSLLYTNSATSKTIYSVPFDYTKATPSSVYFSGKSRTDVDHLCKTGEHASTADLAACSQRNFERVIAELNALIKSEEADYENNDIDLSANGNPIALPYFEKAQRSWSEYRDNQCYAETYSLGEASMRYMTFWDCMARITEERIHALNSVED